MWMRRPQMAPLLALLLAPSMAMAQAPDAPTAPPLVGVDDPVDAVELPPPASGPIETVKPPPGADTHSEQRIRAGENRTQRLLFSSLGAVAGVALAAAPSIALFASGSCRTRAGGEGCALLSVATFFPGVALLPPLGIYVLGRAFGGAGGYWWTVLGSAAGWLLAGALYSAVGASVRGNDVLFVLGGGCAVAAAAGVLAYEWSSWRNLAPPKTGVAGLMLVPWTAPGRAGLGIAGGF